MQTNSCHWGPPRSDVAVEAATPSVLLLCNLDEQDLKDAGLTPVQIRAWQRLSQKYNP